MFSQFEPDKIFRFKEFDEARVFIEKFEDNKNSYEAIDYMISHKEYYFLLKNIKLQKPKKSIISYIFFNIPCLKREEDLEMIIDILSIPHAKEIVIEYLKSCRDEEFAKELYNRGYKLEAIEIFKVLPSISEWFKNNLDNNKKILKKAIEFFEIYDEKYADKLRQNLGN
jgi:hypothetical protein